MCACIESCLLFKCRSFISRSSLWVIFILNTCLWFHYTRKYLDFKIKLLCVVKIFQNTIDFLLHIVYYWITGTMHRIFLRKEVNWLVQSNRNRNSKRLNFKERPCSKKQVSNMDTLLYKLKGTAELTRPEMLKI